MTDLPVTIRRFRADDMDAMLRFARALPEHDLLFLSRDLKHRKVIEAWAEAVEDGFIDSFVAEDGDAIVATCALVRDPLGWSTHVGEVRLLVSPELRGQGVGRRLLDEMFVAAQQRDLKKLVAQMTPDQRGAIQLFEESGFRGEALLKDHVMDRQGQLHDLAILSLDVAQFAARHEAFGLGGA
ncbi:GNAT family N-acetyltransferase [Sphingomonas sp.]|uniref:GNAT family N-acetyltransferase n=1 Tax=Sphingomonas sp. TaxID=28214 RepID=UPI002DEB9FC8|nr:GNAT family N-acetyltransferase [Sphingomonas sp.]